MLTCLHPMQKALGLIPELREDKEASLNYSVSSEWNPACSVKGKHLSALDTYFVVSPIYANGFVTFLKNFSICGCSACMSVLPAVCA